MNEAPWSRKDLLGIAELSVAEIERLLATAESFAEVAGRPIKKLPTLRGKTVVNLFFEPSTRTRVSFEIAAHRLSADVVNFAMEGSSQTKGETLADTADTIASMAPDFVVVRHPHAGVPAKLARRLACGVVNAGDGAHEHPTQALLDAVTIRKHKGRIAGLTVAMIGDIAHSRVVRSNVHLLTRMGARVRVAGPRTMVPRGIETLGVEVHHRIEEALAGADVVMMLRLQLERQRSVLFPSIGEYAALFGLDAGRLALAAPDAIVLHPGPMNRNVEISSEVADGAQSVILEQVGHGVAVRMAALYLMAGARGGLG
ncbi:MAG: aspartate carbamoyltransferase [Acidobacteriota bacterium]